MDKESTYLLQLIDCNCNNCGYMDRDFEAYKKWYDFHYNISKNDFEREKKRLLDSGIPELIVETNKMKFQFEKRYLLNYGTCTKFEKKVSFIPDTCQLETQECFLHRKDFQK